MVSLLLTVRHMTKVPPIINDYPSSKRLHWVIFEFVGTSTPLIRVGSTNRPESVFLQIIP